MFQNGACSVVESYDPIVALHDLEMCPLEAKGIKT
jgi:hypothetical protein